MSHPYRTADQQNVDALLVQVTRERDEARVDAIVLRMRVEIMERDAAITAKRCATLERELSQAAELLTRRWRGQ